MHTPRELAAADKLDLVGYGAIPILNPQGLEETIDPARPLGHPRRVPVSTISRGFEVWRPFDVVDPPVGGLGGGWGANDGKLIEVSAAGYSAGQAFLTADQVDELDNARIFNIATSYWRQAKMYDEAGPLVQTYRWPERLVEAIAESWGQAGFTGAGNGLIAATLHLDTVDVATPCISVIAKHTKGNEALRAHFVNGPYFRHEYDEVNGSPYRGANWSTDTARRRSPRGASIPMEVINLSESEDENGITPRVIDVHPRSSEQASVTNITGLRIAKAWYCKGERFITLEKLLTTPSSGRLYLEAVRVSDDGDGETLQTFRITGVSSVVVDGDTVHRAHVYTQGRAPIDPLTGEPLQTMVEHEGDGRIELRTTAVFDAETSIGEVCLQLMCSSGGNDITSSVFDKLAIGAGLVTKTEASDQFIGHVGPDIDTQSFLRIASPMRNARYAPQWRDGQTVYEVVSGILRASGYVMDIRTDAAGACRLTAVPLGRPTNVEIIANLGETDIASRPSPKSPVETT
ncbi:MAG: hypothetical protein VYD85_06740, partial [Pseudomonadota bacterium]|nr:hypothetical protein [Pseudomonadota bacterium]